MDELKILFDHVAGKIPDFTKIDMEANGVRLTVERAAVHAAVPAAPARQSDALPAPGASEAPASAPAPLIKSPIVGTFYAAPAPDAPPFVSSGQKVRKGQVLCIIEAMKMMNEIESETDGTVSKVLVSNGALVEFGQPLFELAGDAR